MYAPVRPEEEAAGDDEPALRPVRLVAVEDDVEPIDVIELATLSGAQGGAEAGADASPTSSATALSPGPDGHYAQAQRSFHGLLLMLVASLFFSLMALLVSALSATGVPVSELVFFRSLVGFVVTAGYLFATDGSLIGLPQHRPLLILRGVLGTLSVRAHIRLLSLGSLA